jgi:hypothetical protein
VCYDSLSVCERMSHQVIIRYEKEGVDGGRLIALSRGPGADRTQCRQQPSIGFQKEVISTICGPICEPISYSLNLVAYSFDAEYLPCLIALNQPVPERRAKIQSIMEVFA